MSYGLPCPTSPPGSKCWLGQQHIVALCGSWWPQDRVSVWVVAVFSLLSFLFSRSLNHRFAPKGTLPHCPNRKRYPTPEHFTPTMRPTMHRPWGAPRQRASSLPTVTHAVFTHHRHASQSRLGLQAHSSVGLLGNEAILAGQRGQLLPVLSLLPLSQD